MSDRSISISVSIKLSQLAWAEAKAKQDGTSVSRVARDALFRAMAAESTETPSEVPPAPDPSADPTSILDV